MSVAAIVLVCTVSGALLSGGVLVARAVRAWASEVAALRQEIAALRLEMERARREDQTWYREHVQQAIKEHATGCTGPAMWAVSDAHRNRS